MAKAMRPLTVMKVEWRVAPRRVPTSGILGTLKATIEAGGKYVDSLRDIKVRGSIRRAETKAEEERRLRSEDDCPGGPAGSSLLDTYRVTKLEYPDYKRTALATAHDLKVEEHLRRVVSDIVRGQVASTLPKFQKVTVVLWDPDAEKSKRLMMLAGAVKLKKWRDDLARKRRGPGRNPKKKFNW